VKLSTTSREGKVLVLKIVEPREVMGLSAVIAGEAYEISAETLGPCLVNFVERDGLLRLMERSGEPGLRSAQAVSREFQYAYREIHELVLAKSSSGKLARLLLSWVNVRDNDVLRELRIHAPVTHEEMNAADWSFARNGNSLAERIEEERLDQAGRYDAGHQKSDGT
jgi:CRP/FNR family cyclic AMP-dependent transcriptional regulator